MSIGRDTRTEMEKESDFFDAWLKENGVTQEISASDGVRLAIALYAESKAAAEKIRLLRATLIRVNSYLIVNQEYRFGVMSTKGKKTTPRKHVLQTLRETRNK